jgi:Zn-dependent protease with chaperone function
MRKFDVAEPQRGHAKRACGRHAFVGALLVLVGGAKSGVAWAESFDRAWSVKEIATSPGDQIRLTLPSGGALKSLSASSTRQLYAVYSALASVSEVEADFVMVHGKLPNAFAGTLSTGELVVGINFAMFDMIEKDLHAVAAVLGHELAHIKLGHVVTAKQTEAQRGMLKAIGQAVMGGLIPGGGLLSDLTVDTFHATHSREQESQADYLGAIWAVEAGFDPYGAVRLHEMLLKRVGGSGSFLSTHPSGPARIESLKGLAQRLK